MGDSTWLGNDTMTFHKSSTMPTGIYKQMTINHGRFRQKRREMKCISSRCCTIWSRQAWKWIDYPHSSHLRMLMGNSIPFLSFLIRQVMLKLNRRSTTSSNRIHVACHNISAAESKTSDHQCDKCRKYLRSDPSCTCLISHLVVVPGKIYHYHHGSPGRSIHREKPQGKAYSVAAMVIKPFNGRIGPSRTTSIHLPQEMAIAMTEEIKGAIDK